MELILPDNPTIRLVYVLWRPLPEMTMLNDTFESIASETTGNDWLSAKPKL